MLVTQMFKQKKAHRIVTIRPETTVAEAAKILKKEHIGALMVTADDGALAGILSERDIVRAIPEHGAELHVLTVAHLMTRQVETCGPEGRVYQIMKTMTTRHFRHMPVLEDGKLIGMISIGDVVKSRLDELEADDAHMRNFIAGIE
jgi:CBS domain-containing protein